MAGNQATPERGGTGISVAYAWSLALRIAEHLCAASILGIAAIVLYEIVARGLFDAPTVWVQEVAVYLLLIAGFLGLAPTLAAGEHIRIDILSRRFSEPLKRSVEVATLLAVAGFAAIATW